MLPLRTFYSSELPKELDEVVGFEVEAADAVEDADEVEAADEAQPEVGLVVDLKKSNSFAD